MISNHLSLGTEVTKWFSIQPLFFWILVYIFSYFIVQMQRPKATYLVEWKTKNDYFIVLKSYC